MSPTSLDEHLGASLAAEVLEVPGARLAWGAWGAGDPLVLVHGFTGSSVDWAGVIEPLATERRVVVADNRGHGASTAADPTGFDIDQLVDDLVAVLDAAVGDRPVDLLGHSLGGIVALRLALARPERIRSLLLMDTMASPPSAMGSYLLAGVEQVERDGMAPMIELMGSMPVTGEHGAAVRARTLAKVAAMDPAAFVGLGRALVHHEPVLDRLGEITLPTTVVVGEHDVGLRGPADDLAAGIPGARLVVIPGAQHSPQDENRAAFLDAVRAHLAARP